jgi:predicted metal-dependent hydrolase
MHKLLQQIDSLLENLEKVLQRRRPSKARGCDRGKSGGKLKLLKSKRVRVARDSNNSSGCDASQAIFRLQQRLNNDPLIAIWCKLAQDFFPDLVEHLGSYQVSWSARPQKRVLASCNIRRRRIIVAQELFEPSATRWLAPVLYHEMCHAVIGEGVNLSQSGRRMWHGRQFRQLEARHPDIPAMNAWIRSGGWAMAVRSHRARRAWRARTA